jgi:cytochrome c oxidase subunit 2
MKTRDLAVVIVGLVLVAGAYLLLPGKVTTPREEVQPTGVTKEFTINAQQWSFIPNVIEAALGDNVKIEVKGIDYGTGSGHGFSLSAFNVNEFLRKDGSVVVEFFAGKTGSFTFICTVPCGRGHGGMRGTLTIS